MKAIIIFVILAQCATAQPLQFAVKSVLVTNQWVSVHTNYFTETNKTIWCMWPHRGKGRIGEVMPIHPGDRSTNVTTCTRMRITQVSDVQQITTLTSAISTNCFTNEIEMDPLPQRRVTR